MLHIQDVARMLRDNMRQRLRAMMYSQSRVEYAHNRFVFFAGEDLFVGIVHHARNVQGTYYNTHRILYGEGYTGVVFTECTLDTIRQWYETVR